MCGYAFTTSVTPIFARSVSMPVETKQNPKDKWAELPVLQEPKKSPAPRFKYTAVVEDRIDAGHKLHLPYESKCNREHGHMYRIRVTIGALKLDANGMVVDFTHVKEVLRKYDHRVLNEFFEPTTAEKFAEILMDELNDAVFRRNPAAFVVEVGVGETPDSWVAVTYDTR
jgi:6-pyruvoyltetrahydropterin/6-carboxytetrahydropterin synthase